MVVALGALEAHAKEQLRGVFKFGLWLAYALIPDDGRIVLEIARGGEDLPNELVVGFVLEEAVADPGMEGVGAAGLSGFGSFVAEQCAPFVGEIVRVIGAGEETVDKGLAGRLATVKMGSRFSPRSSPLPGGEGGAFAVVGSCGLPVGNRRAVLS